MKKIMFDIEKHLIKEGVDKIKNLTEHFDANF